MHTYHVVMDAPDSFRSNRSRSEAVDCRRPMPMAYMVVFRTGSDGLCVTADAATAAWPFVG